MRRTSLITILCLAAPTIFAASSTSSAQRLLKPEDFAQFRDVDEPHISPDGNLVAYVVKTVDMEKDKLPGNLWLAKWDGSENRPLTYGNNDQSHPRWSPDGKWIAFLSEREDENASRACFSVFGIESIIRAPTVQNHH